MILSSTILMPLRFLLLKGQSSNGDLDHGLGKYLSVDQTLLSMNSTIADDP